MADAEDLDTTVATGYTVALVFAPVLVTPHGHITVRSLSRLCMARLTRQIITITHTIITGLITRIHITTEAAEGNPIYAVLSGMGSKLFRSALHSDFRKEDIRS